MNMGSDVWAKQAGNNGEKGLKLYGMCGDISKATIVEQPVGTTLNSLLKEAGAKNVEYAEIGGTTERIAPKADFDEVVGFRKAQFNGVGSIVLFNGRRNITQIYEDKMHFMWEVRFNHYYNYIGKLPIMCSMP